MLRDDELRVMIDCEAQIYAVGFCSMTIEGPRAEQLCWIDDLTAAAADLKMSPAIHVTPVESSMAACIKVF